jgi:glutaredoxin 3
MPGLDPGIHPVMSQVEWIAGSSPAMTKLKLAAMARIVLYTTQYCGYCRAAKQLLRNKGLEFEEIDVAFDPDLRAEMVQRANGMRTVPQIFIHGRHVGGYQELSALERQGKLEDWLAEAPVQDSMS